MAPPSDTAERVLTAAAELFAERGYGQTSTRAIAERAGVNEVTIFRRFATKAGILRAIGEGLAERSAGHAVAVTAEPQDTPGTLIRLARLEIASALENGGLALRLAFEARSTPEIADLLGAGSQRNAAGLTAYLADRQQAGDLRDDVPAGLLAEAFFALTSSLVMGRALMGGPAVRAADADRLADDLCSLFWSGACAQPTTADAVSTPATATTATSTTTASSTTTAQE
jgi:AcrR family transcriptional regulator